MEGRSLQNLIKILADRYGSPPNPAIQSALELILWENIAYLADDERRQKAFDLLRQTVGTTPEAVLGASDESLLGVASYGIVPDQTVAKLRRIAQVAIAEFPNGLDAALNMPYKEALRALKRFPAIGDPSAHKILLFTHTHLVFTLESNGLRVLQRIGYGTDTGRYDADYKAVMRDIAEELPAGFDERIEAYLILRRHGQNICRRGEPSCIQCPLIEFCDTGIERVSGHA